MFNADNTSSKSNWTFHAIPYGSNDSFLLSNIFPVDIANSSFSNVRDEVHWNETRQPGGRVPRDISIQGTIHIDNGDEYEPLYRPPADEQPELHFLSQRISLTFRTIATFRNRRTEKFYEQGARCKTKDELLDEKQKQESLTILTNNDEKDLLSAFSAENKQSSDFDWNHYYGKGFNALNFKVLNSTFLMKKKN